MEIPEPVRSLILRSSLIIMLGGLSSCSFLIPPPEPVEPVVVAEPELTPEPVPRPEPPPVVIPEPVSPQNIGPLVAVVISDRTPAFVDVANALDAHLENNEVYDLSDRSLAAETAFTAIADSGASAVVAVGFPAARAARKYSTLPVVVGQVFNIHAGDLLSDDVRAVGALPPIQLQIAAWRDIDPSLRNVGAILGPGHEELIAETNQALKEQGIKFHYAIAESDRETLYLFNRLAREIDGYILFPDNRILSRSVLGEMMSYASRHRVQVAVFNEPLLDHGATFSAVSVPADIAATITRVLDKILSGNIETLPRVTGLSEIDVRTNPSALHKLGLGSDQSTASAAMATTK